MPVFAVTYRYVDDPLARDAVRPAHRRFLRGLAERGALLVSGPYAAAEEPGALLVLRGASKDEVLALLAGDPFAVQGIVTATTAIEWEPVTGALSGYFAQSPGAQP
jgi:hypothetical protein